MILRVDIDILINIESSTKKFQDSIYCTCCWEGVLLTPNFWCSEHSAETCIAPSPTVTVALTLPSRYSNHDQVVFCNSLFADRNPMQPTCS
jgi:hypothetical protein